MQKVKTYIIIVGLFLCVLAGFWLWGYATYPKKHKPVITNNTIIIHDTTKRIIVDRIPYYVVKTDTIIQTKTVFTKVDTAKILQDYYAIHYYTRTWQDSLLRVTLEDAITENQSIDNKFTYEILRPTQIANNIAENLTHYNRYLNFGIDVPIKNINYIEIESIFNWEKGYLGMGYTPQLKTFNIKLGAVLFQFKK